MSSRKTTDLLWYPGVCLLAEGHADQVAAQNFTGMDVRPVNLFRDSKCKKPAPGFVEMRITGRVPVDEEKSGMRMEYCCPICGYTQHSQWEGEKGLHFAGDFDDWPELFKMTQGVTSHIFVKPRFAQLMIDLKLRPVMLTRLEDIQPFKMPGTPRADREVPSDIEGYLAAIQSMFDEINIYDSPEDFLGSFASADSKLGLLYAVHMCQSEVANGGLPQFFVNSTGVLAPEAIQGFLALGMPNTAQVVSDASQLLGVPYPRRRLDRINQLGKLGRKKFAKLNDRFYELIESENGGFQEAADRFSSELAP